MKSLQPVKSLQQVKTPAGKDDKESLAESDRGEEMNQETIEEEIENDYEEK